MPQRSRTFDVSIFFAKSSPIARTFRFDSASEAPSGRDVAVVEGEERHAEQVEHLEGDVGLHLRAFHLVRGVHPRTEEGLAAEGVAARPAERVPVADGEAELVLHPLAEHLLVRVVPAVGEALPLPVPDRILLGEEWSGHRGMASLMAG